MKRLLLKFKLEDKITKFLCGFLSLWFFGGGLVCIVSGFVKPVFFVIGSVFIVISQILWWLRK